MERRWQQFQRVPDRYPPKRAKWMLAVAAFVLLLAGSWFWVGDTRSSSSVMSPIVLGLAGVGNLALCLGSLLPEGRRAVALRSLAVPLGVLLLLASAIWFVWFAVERF